MQDVIREGSLRVAAAESSCDVIVSGLGYKLMAHKIILSMASPVLQELLQDAASQQQQQQPTTLIFADVSATTMSLLLDYIYTGYVTLRMAHAAEFLTLAQLLKIRMEDECLRRVVDGLKSRPQESGDGRLRKLVPELIPIRHARGLFNKVIPSPWTPRDNEVLLDPRSDRLYASYNDSNNNIERTASSPSRLTKELVLGTATTATIGCRSRHDMPSSSPKTQRVFSVHSLQDTEAATITKQEKQHDVLEIVRAEHTDAEEKCATGNRKDDTDGRQQESSKKDKSFKCDDCGKQFSQLRNYKYHRSVHDGTKEFATKCPECGKVFNDRGYLSSHMKIHRDRKEYACQHCPKRFNQRVAYNMHLRIHTGIKPHECAICGKSFSRKMLLKQHQRVHTGERPYTCAECGKSFADRSNMSLHARLHTGVKPYSCTLCTKSFTKKHHLKTHMNFHTGLKPYSCEKCGLSFSQSSNMRTHYKKCILKRDGENPCSTSGATPS